MDPLPILTLSLGVTALGGALLAVFLWRRAAGEPGARPLAAFLAVVGLWSLGLLIPNAWGAALLALAPLGGSTFVHFAVGLTGRGREVVPWGHGLAALATGGAWLLGAGHFLPWPGLGLSHLFQYDGAGWAAVATTLILATLGQGLLALAWIRDKGLARRRAGMALLSGLLGLAPLVGLAFPLLGLEGLPPWPLVALPVYLLGLVFAMVRYRMMAANRWAARAVAWGAMVLLAALVSAVFAGVLAGHGGAPFPWIAGALLLGLALADPLRRLADRLIYPGGAVEPETLTLWRRALAEADDEAGLEARAGALLASHLGTDLGEDRRADLEHAPPGARRAAGVMAETLAWAREDLARRAAFAERERLAELGALAATVAHDLRNPMNTLSMALTELPPATREVARRQMGRMDALVADLLDYAKPWSAQPRPVDLGSLVADLDPKVETDLEPGLTLWADPERLRQALANLLDNARAGAARVQVAAIRRADGGARLEVRDDGPGIPEDIRDRVFQPFVSRSPQGTGLGLAIVAKVMAAHGGEATLASLPGWTTVVALDFPGKGATP